ncbi:MAG: ribonuclease J [Synechococcus sp.]
MPTKSKTQSPAVQMIPLGGEQEIGKNTWVFQCEDEIILLDAGLSFPDADMHGVNIVLPDVTYLKQNREKIKAMVVTHGHEDHIGGIAYHLKEFDIPVIYGPKLALAILEGKLKEAGVLNRTELRTVAPRDLVPLSKNFFAEFIRNTHSFADSFTIALHTPAGVVIQTGDFKFDHTPVDGETFDIQRLAEHGEKGVLCLISDSTNAELPGFTPSESAVRAGLSRAFANAKGRIIVTTFASSVHRVNMILQQAEASGRVVSLLGRSMLNVVDHARRLGYIRCKDETLQRMNVVDKMPDDQVVILTTGSQGESLAALTRIANKEHRQLSIRPGDTVVWSANPIPGNVIPVVRTIDKLVAQGAHVVYGKDKGLHVSGHGAQEDQKLMLALTKPKFFVPTHGEYRMLVKHAETAMSMGVPQDNIVIIDNGDVVEVTPDSIQAVGKVPSGLQLVDQSRSGMVADKVLQERQQVANDGLVAIACAVTNQGKLSAPPSINIVAVANADKTLEQQIRQTIGESLIDHWGEFTNTPLGTSAKLDDVDWAGLKSAVERSVVRLLRSRLQGRPMVMLMMQTPADGEESAAGRRRKSSAKAAKTETVEEAPAKATRTRRRRSAAAASA